MKFRFLTAILLMTNTQTIFACPHISAPVLHQALQNHQQGLPLSVQGRTIIGLQGGINEPIGINQEILTAYRDNHLEVRSVTPPHNGAPCDYSVVSRNIHPPLELLFNIRLQ